MRRDIDMNALWSAVRLAGYLADREYSRAVGPDAYREAKSSQLTAQRGMAAYDALAQEWPRMQDLRSAADREYDRYVTREPSIEDRGCSCHISAPCSYCTRDADSADDDRTQDHPPGGHSHEG